MPRKKPTVKQLRTARELLEHLRASVLNRKQDNIDLHNVAGYLYDLEQQWGEAPKTEKSNNPLN